MSCAVIIDCAGSGRRLTQVPDDDLVAPFVPDTLVQEQQHDGEDEKQHADHDGEKHGRELHDIGGQRTGTDGIDDEGGIGQRRMFQEQEQPGARQQEQREQEHQRPPANQPAAPVDEVQISFVQLFHDDSL